MHEEQLEVSKNGLLSAVLVMMMMTKTMWLKRERWLCHETACVFQFLMITIAHRNDSLISAYDDHEDVSG